MKFRMRNKQNALTWVLLAILAVQLLSLFFKTVPAYRNAEKNGTALGVSEGRKVGMYLGSLQGTKDGIEESEKQGLSTSELSAKLTEIMNSAGKVQILAEAAGTDYLLSSEDENHTGTTAVFTVDFSRSEISVSGEKSLIITIPEPECTAWDTDTGTEIANGISAVPASAHKEARRLAVSHAEDLADIVCGQMCTCTVSVNDSEGGDADE